MPPLRRFLLEFWNGGGIPKTTAMPLPAGGKIWRYICIRFDTIPQCDGQTDRQTDRNGKTISRSACCARWRAIKTIQHCVPYEAAVSTVCDSSLFQIESQPNRRPSIRISVVKSNRRKWINNCDRNRIAICICPSLRATNCCQSLAVDPRLIRFCACKAAALASHIKPTLRDSLGGSEN